MVAVIVEMPASSETLFDAQILPTYPEDFSQATLVKCLKCL